MQLCAIGVLGWCVSGLRLAADTVSDSWEVSADCLNTGEIFICRNVTTSNLSTQVQKKVFWSGGCPSCCCCWEVRNHPHRGEVFIKIFIKMICLQVHVTTSYLATQEQLVAGAGLRLDADSTLGCTSSIALLAPRCLYKQHQRGRAFWASDAVCLGSEEHSTELVHTGLVRCEERTIWIWIEVGSLSSCSHSKWRPPTQV